LTLRTTEATRLQKRTILYGEILETNLVKTENQGVERASKQLERAGKAARIALSTLAAAIMAPLLAVAAAVVDHWPTRGLEKRRGGRSLSRT